MQVPPTDVDEAGQPSTDRVHARVGEGDHGARQVEGEDLVDAVDERGGIVEAEVGGVDPVGIDQSRGERGFELLRGQRRPVEGDRGGQGLEVVANRLRPPGRVVIDIRHPHGRHAGHAQDRPPRPMATSLGLGPPPSAEQRHCGPLPVVVGLSLTPGAFNARALVHARGRHWGGSA
ncbi:MAG: hypothetical protein ABIU87_00330 [Ornithinibacter sp.]